MAVKTSQSGARMLAVLEAIAAEQPVGASALARRLDEDKSAVQRSLVTLSRAGWIAPTDERPVRWELSARLFSLAHLPHSSEDLRRRAAPALGELRDRTGETAFLAIPDLSHFIVVEVAESRQTLRTAPRIGEVIEVSGTATGRVMLANMSEERRARLLGRDPTPEESVQFEACRRRGYGISVGEVMAGSSNIAAPIIGPRGEAVAALGISAPTDRLSAEMHDSVGALLALQAQRLSQRGAVLAPA